MQTLILEFYYPKLTFKKKKKNTASWLRMKSNNEEVGEEGI